ncbi:SusC/RagA family TonB-linked outer membrane protein [Xylanibacter brevis]|uniref:SusC/RagA family TonB-linked outer membrane protein n=1 Tax=Xylanibacter brevis TaxID=83231 RepID=UPI00048223D0|nr:SusC/RagA family TonB-linked outer membrane protein [Xylanibacter brevis]
MKILKSMIFVLALLLSTAVGAQNITSVHGTLSDELGPLMGATVCEIDATGRIIESAVTDLNGNFTMKIRNPKDHIRFSYVGLNTITQPINKTTYNIKMTSKTVLKEVTIKSKKRATGNSLPIPQREISYATQTISMKEFEGLGITSVDEALQGRIAGLDIIGNSGDLGSGSTMRLRGASSLSSLTDANPLIVVDGNIREVSLDNFDMAGANNEKFAELLNINPEDIASITVLKDAAATAVYGSQGGNGVIELTTKRGVRGKPKLTYTLKLTGTYQPKGYDLLSGDDYTMMLKEAYFNPMQDGTIADKDAIPEINYMGDNEGFTDWREYRANTDWRDAVTQWGLRQNHYVTISGGGEKASFRIGGGFDHETGTMIKQKLNRFSTRVALDYNVSSRIRISTNFALTYTKNDMNSDNLLSIAQRIMPNMSIYVKDPVTGLDTSDYFTMRRPRYDGDPMRGSDVFEKDQRTYVNPVASANLAKNQRRTYDMSPELVINYQLLGTDEDHWQLNWRGSVYMNIFNQYDDKYYPWELNPVGVKGGVNSASKGSSKSVSFNTKQTLTLTPAFTNKDHSMMMMGRFELTSGSSNGQATGANGLASGVSTPTAGGLNFSPSSWYNQWRSMYYTFSTHYAYKGRYVADFTLRADGTTKFGPNNRWGFFPSVSLKWIVSDEPWMQKLKPTLSMLAIRPSWGRVGNQPNQNYLFTSKYGTTDRYIDMAGMVPLNLRLTDLKWQIVSSYNLGMDLGFLDDRLNMTIEAYSSTTTDMLLQNYRIPSNAGFAHVPYRNSGKMRNTGWEFHINTNRLIKAGKFIMDLNANFGNNRNEILEMDEYLLKNLNSTFSYENGEFLRYVQLHNPFGAIYGFKYKGVYTHNYNTFIKLTPAEQQGFLNGTLPDEWYAERGWEKRPYTAPVAMNADGKLILDATGTPVRMVYNYTNDNTGKNVRFNGGDAMYEDINHDGQINALDITYLGSSLPKLTGGFGFSFNYGDWRLTTQFNYRVGNKIINMARLRAEAMTGNDNQSQAVNYRWRKEGDVTSIPRAMHYFKDGPYSYNSLVSDRFVEDGSYLRMSYAQLSYAIKKKYLTWIGLNRISLYASINNPFVITKYSGVDPDISNAGYDPAIDNAQTPRSRSYTLGLTVDF